MEMHSKFYEILIISFKHLSPCNSQYLDIAGIKGNFVLNFCVLTLVITRYKQKLFALQNNGQMQLFILLSKFPKNKHSLGVIFAIIVQSILVVAGLELAHFSGNSFAVGFWDYQHFYQSCRKRDKNYICYLRHTCAICHQEFNFLINIKPQTFALIAFFVHETLRGTIVKIVCECLIYLLQLFVNKCNKVSNLNSSLFEFF